MFFRHSIRTRQKQLRTFELPFNRHLASRAQAQSHPLSRRVPVTSFQSKIDGESAHLRGIDTARAIQSGMTTRLCKVLGTIHST